MYIIKGSGGYLGRNLEWTDSLEEACKGNLSEVTRTVQSLGLSNFDIVKAESLISSKYELYAELKDKLGTTNQTIVAIEELSELQKELCKGLRGKGNKDNLVEEMADVEIMMEQLKLHFDIFIDVEAQKEVKLERTMRRLKGD